MTFCGVKCPFGQFGSAVLTMLPPGFLCTSPLAELGELERSEVKHYSATTKATKLNTLKSVINIILILNPNHIAVPGARMRLTLS